MRQKPRDHGELGSKFTCGRWVLVFDVTGARWVQIPCGQWTCDYCREIHIGEWKWCVDKEIPGNLFVRELGMPEKKLSAYIRKNVKGAYFLVHRPDGSAVLITRFKVKGSTRHAKKEYLDREFSDILREPWPKGKRRKGISTRHGVRPRKTKQRSYCFVFGAGRGDNEEFKGRYKRIAEAFKKLRTDVDRGRFFYDLSSELGDEAKIWEPGEKLIEKYHSHIEKEERLSIIAEGMPVW